MSRPDLGTGVLPEARRAFEEHRWSDAYEGYRGCEETELTPRDLEGFAEAAFWVGHLEECMRARERAYARFVEEGDTRRAGYLALQLARDHDARLANPVARGWFARAERLLGADEDCVEHGFLLREYAHRALGAGDFERTLELGEQVAEHGRRFGNRDLEIVGRHEQGLARVARGEVDEGLLLLDEAMVSAVSGELSPFWTGAVYCNLIEACRNLADYGRAGKWTELAERWCEEQSISGFPGICRIRRAEVLRLRGAWADAEAQVRHACAELATHYVVYQGAAFYEIGEIRLRMGDLAAAEEAFTQAHRLGHDPQPGLALVWLARGDRETAAAAVRRAMEEPTRLPLIRSRLLPAATEVLLADRDVRSATRAVEELEEVAATYGSAALTAAALGARGAVELATGAREAAASRLQQALLKWQEVDAPYEAARTRLLLAQAYDVLGDAVTAQLERDAARTTLEHLGAAVDLADWSLPDSARRAGSSVTTFMFTDIVRSTELVAVIGDVAWADLGRWHDRVLRELVTDHGGEVVKNIGDGLFAAFHDAAAAVRCAVAVQRALAEHRREHGFAPAVRIGLHAGEAVREGADFAGIGVHEAARVGSLADAGEVVASAATITAADLALTTSSPRRVSLKGVAEPVEVVSIDWN